MTDDERKSLRPGDRVLVRDDHGNEAEYEVKYPPWKMGHGEWVIGLKGIVGGYLLFRVVRRAGSVVYLVLRSVAYEGESVSGVYGTFLAAQECAQRLAAALDDGCTDTEYLVYSWRCGEPKGQLLSRHTKTW